MMPEITGGQTVHDALVKLGVKHVFGIPSVHNLPTFKDLMSSKTHLNVPWQHRDLMFWMWI